jgi:hypothetical protein
MSKTDRVKIRAAERRALAFELRKRGMSYRKIAEEIIWEFGLDDIPKGYDSRIAWMDVTAELKKLREQMATDVADVRRMELERLDQLQEAIWDKALAGEAKAGDQMLRIMKRRADVMGIDAAEKHVVANLDMSKLTYEQLERLSNGENVFDVMFPSKGGDE